VIQSARFWTIAALLCLTLFALYRRGNVDHVPPSRPLDDLPLTLDHLYGTSIPIDPGVLQVMGKGFFLNRLYAAPAGANLTPIALFIGYFPTQRTGQSIHSPQHCLPGSGWSFVSAGTTTVPGANGSAPETVGDYLITDGTNRDEVLYWYQSQGHAIASDYTAKLYMLADSIRYERTDAALVRIITPVLLGESREAARERAVGFAAQLRNLLPDYVPN
jgi:EpsI family protein